MTWIAQLVGMAVNEAGRTVQYLEDLENVNTRVGFIKAQNDRQVAEIRKSGDRDMRAWLTRANETNILAQRVANTGNQQIAEIGLEGERQVARVQANAAAHGIEWDSGSPLEMAAEVGFEFEKEAALKHQEASWQIGALLTDVDNAKRAAIQARWVSENQAYSTILTGIAQMTGLVDSLPTGTEMFMKSFSSGMQVGGSILGGGGGGGGGASGGDDFNLDF